MMASRVLTDSSVPSAANSSSFMQSRTQRCTAPSFGTFPDLLTSARAATASAIRPSIRALEALKVALPFSSSMWASTKGWRATRRALRGLASPKARIPLSLCARRSRAPRATRKAPEEAMDSAARRDAL